MNCNEVKRMILRQFIGVDDLEECFNNNFNETISGIYKALYILLKDYKKNRNKINILIGVLENNILFKDDKNLDHIINCSINLNTMIVKNYEVKYRILIKEVLTRIDNIVNIININREKNYSNSSKNSMLLIDIIFNVRNFDIIKLLIDKFKNLFDYKDINGDDIFSIILKEYVKSSDTQEIDYFYKVIMLFIKNDNFYTKGNIVRYKSILYSNFNKQHVRDVFSILDGNFDYEDLKLENRYNIRFYFPDDINDEISNFKLDIDGRVNFTNQLCITIDDKENVCLDDAISITENIDGTYTLFVHIPDVPSFIPYYSYTNEEARYKGETLYLIDRSINMYPNYISNNYCSLLPCVKRNVLSYVVDLDKNMDVIDESFVVLKGIIISKHKMSYREVDEHLNNLSNSSLDRVLYNLSKFAYKQKNNNLYKETYRRYKEEIRKNKDTTNKSYLFNAKIIVEEVMVFINYMVSKYFKDRSLPYIYRTFSLPDNDYLDRKIKELTSINKETLNNKSYLRGLKKSLVSASYSTQALPHDGVGLMCYSHSTSPLRRYSDSYCQYIINDLLFNNNIDDKNIYKWEDINKMLIRYLNEKKLNNELFSKQYNYYVGRKLKLKKNRK